MIKGNSVDQDPHEGLFSICTICTNPAVPILRIVMIHLDKMPLFKPMIRYPHQGPSHLDLQCKLS